MSSRRLVLAGGLALMLAACAPDAAVDPTPDAAVGTSSTAAASTVAPAATATTTTRAMPAFDGVSLAMAAIDAWNSGDFDAWVAYFAPNPGADHLFSQSVMNSNEHVEVTEPCVASAEVSPAVVRCSIHVRDDFHGPGGLTSHGNLEFVFDGSGLIVDTSDTTYEDAEGNCCPAWQEYHRSFHRWLRDAHPDVYEEIGPSGGNPLWFLPGVAGGNADHMLIALDFVDEFVASSDDYPLLPDTTP